MEQPNLSSLNRIIFIQPRFEYLGQHIGGDYRSDHRSKNDEKNLHTFTHKTQPSFQCNTTEQLRISIMFTVYNISVEIASTLRKNLGFGPALSE